MTQSASKCRRFVKNYVLSIDCTQKMEMTIFKQDGENHLANTINLDYQVALISACPQVLITANKLINTLIKL